MSSEAAPINPYDAFADKARFARIRQWRKIKDAMVRGLVVVGGLSVIGALLLIFVYLFSVVMPLFKPASVDPVASYAVPGKQAPTLMLAMEEQAEVAMRLTDEGTVVFFDTASGGVMKEVALPMPEGVIATSLGRAAPETATVGLGLSNGDVLVVRHEYKVTYPDGVRTITPHVVYPLGEAPVEVDETGRPLIEVALQINEDGATIVATNDEGLSRLVYLSGEENFITGEVTFERETSQILPLPRETEYLRVNATHDRLFALAPDGRLTFISLRNRSEPEVVEAVSVTEAGERVTAASFLVGTTSLMIGMDSGRIAQWFPARNAEGEFRLAFIREFRAQDKPIIDIAPEHARKGFAALDAGGETVLYHSTAHQVMKRIGGAGAGDTIAMAPRANAMLVLDEAGRLSFTHIKNPHPEISFQALWGSVWYEGYEEPLFLWQSSAATDDFEPKYSLTPISFGTLKAAFYAMLFAVPLGIMGAIYTAYFMAPRMRTVVKPTVEIMEALPTVILGFLAGLFLAPLAEKHLAGFVTFFMTTPFVVLLFGYAWSRLPRELRTRVPEGYQAALLIPVIVAAVAVSFLLSPVITDVFFGGDVRDYITNTLGWGYDQRNALVVGMAMGFAVIPTIYSIAEDAIFSVPKQLTQGSLALGATPWQTLSRVVILTASPGIFSAVMIGLGRAVGETMIVLMATGNTPVMDWSVFEGMRTLSANIAVEMPESAVGSTHYRVLFLAGLVLFVFTFFFNTVAEVVRQRLRGRYSRL